MEQEENTLNASILTVSHLTKHFGTKQVLSDVSFTVPEHTVFGFVGQNGAGKTTTMKIILGLLQGDSGEVTVNGVPVRARHNRTNRFIGYLPDVPEFYSYMTPSEYLALCGRITGMSEPAIKKRTSELLELVGLTENRRIHGYSRGMKQRLGIAQALFHRPKLLICDEPTSALDPLGRKEILDILTAAREESTVIFSSHILSDVERICDEMALLHNGTIAMSGTLDEIRHKRRAAAIELEMLSAEDAQALHAEFPFLQTDAGNPARLILSDPQALPGILSRISAGDMPFQRIVRLEPTLEDLFMEVIKK